MLEIENRIKSKFDHVSKLESNLERLLQDKDDTANRSIASQSSQLSDTRTVLRLLTSVKRVISKLKIELHQDYLSLGNINVNMLRTPASATSYEHSVLTVDHKNSKV